MSKPKAPQAPDPYQTAQAQTGANKENAAYMAALNRINTYGPTGSSTYTNEGTDPATGAPIYSQRVSLSPEQQQLYNQNTANQTRQSSIAGGLLQGVQDAGSQRLPDLNTNIHNAQDALYRRNTQYLDPQYARSEDQLRTRLLNEGATEGSEAYKNAMTDFQNQKQQAYEAARNDAISGATQQGATQQQMAIAAQNQPLNYYNALMSGNQASMPQFGGAGNISTNPADIAGAMNNNYQGQIANYNANVGSQNQLYGTIGSLAAMMLMASDERVKDDHGVIGETHEGIPIHLFNYKGDDEPRVGVMAQDVEKTKPDAVYEHPAGFKMVDYARLLQCPA